MKNVLLASCAIVASAGAANASFVIEGTLPNDGTGLLTDILFVEFEVVSAGIIEFELLGNGGPIDIGNGPSTLDAEMIIFIDDGDRSLDDIVGRDDEGGPLGNDAFLSLDLAVGSYQAALSAFFITDTEFLNGVNPTALGGNNPDFRFTATGITGVVVPTPGATALAGLAGLSLVRRRR